MKKKLILTLLILTFTFSNVCLAYPNYEYTNFSSDSEKAFQNVSMLSLNSTAMLVKGATRYIDDDNLSLTPVLTNARTFIPLKAAETLFSAYTDGNTGEGKAEFRTGGSQKSSLKDTRIELDNFSARINGEEQTKNEYLVYIDGEAYMPLRKLAELIGYTVYYEDGYILIGNKSDVDAIAENSGYIDYGKTVLNKFIPSETAGQEIYVSPNGKDKIGTGTIDDPYKTIEKATQVAKPGATIILREGTYRETIKPIQNGEPQKPITYKAYKNEKVVVSALEKVTGFTDDEEEDGPNFVKADLSAISGWSNLGRGRNMVFYNDRAVVEARFPNVNPNDYEGDDISPFFPTKGNLKLDWNTSDVNWGEPEKKEWTDSYGSNYYNLTYTSDSKYIPQKVEEWCTYYKPENLNKTWHTQTTYSKVYYVSSDLLKNDGVNDWVGATFVTLHGNAWDWGSAIVDSSKAGSFTVDPESASEKWWFACNDYLNDASRKQINVGYLTNHKKAIDIPEEWNITDSTLYMYLPEGETIDTLNTGKIEVKARQLVADLRNCKYIQIDGIDFVGGSLTADNSEMCVVKNCKFNNTSHFDYSSDQREGYISGGKNGYKKSGEPEAGEIGLYFGGTNDVIRDCTITETAGAAVYLTGAYTMVQNNYMLNCGYAGSNVEGIYIGNKGYGKRDDKRGGYVIKYNTVKNTLRSSLTSQFTEGYQFVCSNSAGEAEYNTNVALMPCDIGYNEFVNGSLGAWDTGLVYLWGGTWGSKNEFTQLHHNLIYMTELPMKDIHSCIYLDNFLNNIEVRDNVMFYTKSDLQFYSNGRYADILVQSQSSFPTAYAEAEVHDNEYLKCKPDGLSSLTDEDYPDGVKFKAGVR